MGDDFSGMSDVTFLPNVNGNEIHFQNYTEIFTAIYEVLHIGWPLSVCVFNIFAK